MSLSEHEKTQFELLTTGLAFDDSDLKKMMKREQATAMSFVALPRISWLSREAVAIAMVFLGIAAIPVSLLFLMLAHNFGAAMTTLFVGGLLISIADMGAVRKATQRKYGSRRNP